MLRVLKGSVCMCVCVCNGFCCLFRNFSGVNTAHMRTNSPHGDQIPVLMWQDLISEVLVKFKGKVRLEIRLRLGYGINWLRLESG